MPKEGVSRAVLVVAVIAMLAASSAGAQTGPRIEAGEDRPVTVPGLSLATVEAHLSIHPRKADHWLVGAIVMEGREGTEGFCVALATFDAGRSWSRHDFRMQSCGDPWTAILDDGTALLAVLGVMGDEESPSLLIYRSADGGKSWDPAPVNLGRNHDHESLLVARVAGSGPGSIQVLSMQDAREPSSGRNRSSLFTARSTDGGRTFASHQHFPSGLSFNTMTAVALSDGTLAFSYDDYGRPALAGFERLATQRSWVTLSKDGGKTLGAPLMITDKCARVFPQLAADNSGGAFNDRLYWVCTDGDYESILLFYSPDRGERWSDSIRVNSGSGRRPYARVPVMAVNKDGVVGVAWYDGRNDREGFKGIFRCQEVYFAASFDGGATFLPEVKVSTAPSCPITSQNGKAGFRWPAGGDYFGLAAAPDGSFHLVWSDARSGPYQMRTNTVRVSGTANAK